MSMVTRYPTLSWKHRRTAFSPAAFRILLYIPDEDFHGTDSFAYVVNDGTVDSAPVAVEITVRSVNDSPVAFSQTVTGIEDTGLSFVLSAIDVDGDDLAYEIITAPTRGSLGCHWNGLPKSAMSLMPTSTEPTSSPSASSTVRSGANRQLWSSRSKP
jgi:hypothetical protein